MSCTFAGLDVWVLSDSSCCSSLQLNRVWFGFYKFISSRSVLLKYTDIKKWKLRLSIAFRLNWNTFYVFCRWNASKGLSVLLNRSGLVNFRILSGILWGVYYVLVWVLLCRGELKRHDLLFGSWIDQVLTCVLFFMVWVPLEQLISCVIVDCWIAWPAIRDHTLNHAFETVKKTSRF